MSKVASTRERLVDGAAASVSRHGLRPMTVAQVVKAAGLSRRTYYQYFSDKEGVVVALYKRVIRDLYSQVEAKVRAKDGPIDRLYAGIDGYLDFQQQGGRVIAQLQAEAINPDSPLWPLREQALDSLVGLIDREVRESTGAALEPRVYRCLFLGMEALVIHERQGGPFAPDSRAQVQSVMRPLFLATLANASSMPKAQDAG